VKLQHSVFDYSEIAAQQDSNDESSSGTGDENRETEKRCVRFIGVCAFLAAH